MKVKMQGRIQKWVDHSISVTINLPNDVDEDLVNRLYVEAWKSGCKGCTVYRDGSRSGVLISTKSDKKSELPPCKPPTVVETRPRILDADVVRFQNNKEKWVAFVGLLDNHPYEIFTGVLDDDEGIILPKNVVSGHIIKNVDEHGNKRYDFHRGSVREVQQRVLELCQADFRCIALPHAYRAGHQAGRFTATGQRKHQHLEERCGTRPEEIHPGRHGSQRQEMPQLR